jgi:DNA polymerase III subunit gamma/tau
VAETSLYRRHRPQAFDEVVGQEHVVRTLRNAVEQDRVHHAYLFVGSRGTGKTSMAKILARCLNCERGGPTTQPCGECESCRAIAAGTSLDVIEMDAASNRSVDDIRELRERVGYVPAAGRWKVYIIDEAHMLTREAWNAFLKTLEEPPPNTVFVLATTEAHKVMPTIVDRCQRFDFQRPSAAQIAAVLERAAGSEGIEVEPGAISAIARSANGSFRDALGTLDQLVAYGGSPVKTDDVLAVLGVADAELIFGAADAVADGDGRAVLETVERLARSGRESSQFIRDLIAHLRQLLVIRTAGTVPDAFTVTPAQDERLREQAERIGDIAAVRAIDALSAAQSAIREWGDDPRAALELALLKAARPDVDPSREALAQRIERLERGASGPIRVTEERQDARGAGTEAERAAPAQSEEAADAEAPKADAGGGAAIRAAATSAAATAEAIDLERVAGLWPAVLDQVRQSGSELLSAVFAAARPLAVDAERAVLEVGFPPSAAFNKRKAEAEGNRERLTEAVRMIVGESLRPVYVLLDGEDAEAANGAEPAMGEDELIERIKAEFDAEEFEPEEDSA